MGSSTALARLTLGLAAVLVAGAPGPSRAASNPSPTTGFLPDTALLARVNDRKISVFDYRSGYYASDPQTRPPQDSTGRVEFLGTMVDKEVMGLTAQALDRPLSFEERLSLREFTESTLATVFFRRKVDDQVVVTEQDLRDLYPQFSTELRLRYILFGDLATAERVRADLKRGRITWKEASRRYSLAPDSLIEGEVGWVSRMTLSGPTACDVFALRPASISAVLGDEEGPKVWQCIDRRNVTPPPYSTARLSLRRDLVAARAAPLRDKLFAEVRVRAEATYDTANIVWLAQGFVKARPHLQQASNWVTVDLTSRAPPIAPADTGRVLARSKRGPFTVQHMISEYQTVPSVLRRQVRGPATLFDIVERMLLEPEIVALAREQGMEKDPEVVTRVAREREALLVDGIYQDSVMAKVRVTEAQRRKYYQDHQKEFVTRELVRYVTIVRQTEAGADSVLARLAAGERAEDIVRADSAAGSRQSRVRSLFGNQAHPHRSIVLEELHPGESTKYGTQGSWIVFRVLDHQYSRPMAYGEVGSIVDESVQNIEAERLLRELLSRLEARYTIEKHSELVMRVRLTNPFSDAFIAPPE